MISGTPWDRELRVLTFAGAGPKMHLLIPCSPFWGNSPFSSTDSGPSVKLRRPRLLHHDGRRWGSGSLQLGMAQVLIDGLPADSVVTGQ
jgi:hypothetical protein